MSLASSISSRLTHELAGARQAWAAGPRRSWLRPHAFELVIYSSLAATVLLLRGSGLALGWQTVTYTLGNLIPSTLEFLFIGALLHAGFETCRGRGWAWASQALGPEGLLTWLRAWLGTLALGYAYIWLKVSIPLLSDRTWDGELWRADVAIHLGVSPTVFVTELFRGSVLVSWLDRFYGAWLTMTLLGTSFLFALGDQRLRLRFLFAHAATWMLGAWIYLAMPALGPFHAHPEALAAVRGSIPRAEATQARLATNHAKMLAGRHGRIPSLNPTLGLAAMPSLHVGVMWLLALWARRVARPLFVLGCVATALTFVGSILTGWHYAVDGYVGFALAQACDAASRFIVPTGLPTELATQERAS